MQNVNVAPKKMDVPLVTQIDRLKEISSWFLMLPIDLAALYLAVWAAYFLRANVMSAFIDPPAFYFPRAYAFFVLPLSFMFFVHYDGLYSRRLPFWQLAEKIFKISIYAILFTLTSAYLTGAIKDMSRFFIVTLWGFSFLFVVVGRYITKKVLMKLGLWQIPTILIGAGKTAETLLKTIEDSSGFGYRIVGVIEDNPTVSRICKKRPLLGTFFEAENIVRRTKVRNVIVAAPGLNRDELVSLVYRLQPVVRDITIVPDLFGVPVGSLQLDTLLNERAVLLKLKNNLARNYNRRLKRLFDLVCSCVGLVLIFPLLVFIAIWIYVESPGPVVFVHERVGKNGRRFPCYKFRTMVMNAQEMLAQYLADNPAAREEWERDFKLKDDPRVTQVGKFLRKTSLDELPQLLNVIKGEMSLVGPRPIVEAEISRYEDYIGDYYMINPGITGMWQVSGRNDVDYASRVQMDSWYVRNWSLWLDIVLLMKTVGVVVKGKGAY